MPRIHRSWRSFAQRFNPDYHSPASVRARREYTRGWTRLAGRVVGVAGSVAAAASANLLAKVPHIADRGFVTWSEMPRSVPYVKRGKGMMGEILPRYQPGQAAGKTEVDRGGYTQTQYAKDRAGKRLNTVQRIMKILASQMTTRVDRFGWLTDATADRAQYDLSAYYTGAVGSRLTMLPVYAMDLTCINQGNNPTLSDDYSKPLLRMYFDEGVDNYKWTSVAGLLADGVTPTYSWDTVYGRNTGANAGSEFFESAFVGQAKVGMYLCGPRKYSSTVWVQVVQFTDDVICPPAYTGPTFTGAGTAKEDFPSTDLKESIRQKEFWLAQTDFLLENPLNKKVCKRTTEGMRVLYSKKFTYNPTLTTESDPSGHETCFNLNYHIDKLCNYRDFPDMKNIVDVDLSDVNKIQAQESYRELGSYVNRKGRVYLLIRASVPTVKTSLPSTAEYYDNYPSFDLQVHRTIHKLRAESSV